MAALKGAGNITVSYNSNDVTNYINNADLQMTVAELEATHLGSTGQEMDPGLPGFTLGLTGDWAVASDGYFAPDILSPTKRTVVIAYTDGASTVTYTWTSAGFLTGYNITGGATDKISTSPALRLSGKPTRAVS